MSVDFWLWLLNKSLCLLKWTCEERFKNVQLKCNLTLSQPNKTSKFTWKQLCWGLFLIMLQAYSKCRPTATVNNCLWNENYFKKWICETNLHTCSWPRNLLLRYSQGIQELLRLIFLECEFISRQYGTNFETDVEQKQFVLSKLKKFWIWFVQFYQKMWREKYGRCRKRTIRRVLICF